jgi:hypothetical protein
VIDLQVSAEMAATMWKRKSKREDIDAQERII